MAVAGTETGKGKSHGDSRKYNFSYEKTLTHTLHAGYVNGLAIIYATVRRTCEHCDYENL